MRIKTDFREILDPNPARVGPPWAAAPPPPPLEVVPPGLVWTLPYNPPAEWGGRGGLPLLLLLPPKEAPPGAAMFPDRLRLWWRENAREATDAAAVAELLLPRSVAAERWGEDCCAAALCDCCCGCRVVGLAG